MIVPPPSTETLALLVSFDVASVQDGKYVYSPEFNRTVQDIVQRPPSRFEQLRIAKRCKQVLADLLSATPWPFSKSPRNAENLITSYFVLHRHLKRTKRDVKITPELVYATWYLNDHQPEVS